MIKKKIKIRASKKLIKEIELDIDTKLSNIRNILENEISFNFIFLNEDKEEIKKEEESEIKLADILDGNYLYLKKVIFRQMLGEKVETKNGLDFYVFPQEELTYTKDQRSINIMVIGEAGVGKSTFLQCFLNYLQGIQIEEKNRYYLFNEKQEEYNRTHPKEQKSSGTSVTDEPAIYNIKPTKVSKDPIRLIDTAGFWDIRAEKYDENIVDDIKELFTNKIDYLNAVRIIFKATDTRLTDRAKHILNILFLLFEKGIKDNIIIIFTFAHYFVNVQNHYIFTYLNDENSPFRKILDPIENLPHYEFENLAYLTNKVELFSYVFDKCQTNFDKLLKYVSNLKPISLKGTVKVLEDRILISDYIKDFCEQMTNVIQLIDILIMNRHDLKINKNRLKNLKSDDIIVEKLVQKKVPTLEKYIDDDHSVKTRIVYHVSNSVIRVVDPEKKAIKEQKQIQREKEISKNEQEIKNLEDEVNKTLKKSLEKIKEIATKENQLNKIALKKYENYGYSKKILDEYFQKIKNEQTNDEAHNKIIKYSDKIKKVFNNTFSRIDSISSNEDIIKEMKDELFK